MSGVYGWRPQSGGGGCRGVVQLKRWSLGSCSGGGYYGVVRGDRSDQVAIGVGTFDAGDGTVRLYSGHCANTKCCGI